MRMFGYKCREVGLIEPSHRLKSDLLFGEQFPKWQRKSKAGRRFEAATQIGPIFPLAFPVADARDPESIAFGMLKRLFPPTISVNPLLLQEFIIFAKEEIDREFKLGSDHGEKEWEEWLESRSYNKSRKAQLRAVHDKFSTVSQVISVIDDDDVEYDEELLEIKGFVKLEEYVEFKYLRNILPRSDKFKNLLGPTIEWAEHKLLEKPWVMKGQNVLDQPSILLDKFGHGCGIFYGTDFSHFEGSYSDWVFDIERYFLMRVAPWAVSAIDLNYWACSELQHIKIQSVSCHREAIRCSGEMTTSLTHTLLNYLLNKFNASKQSAEIVFVGTGDDGLIKSNKELNFNVITQLGFEFKPDRYNFVWEALFCHLVFDPTTCHLFREPREFLVRIGWSLSSFRHTNSDRVLNGLFKAKLMSFMCMYHGCPIIGVLCDHFLKYLKDVTAVQDQTVQSYWMKSIDIVNNGCFVLDIEMSDRLTFQHLFQVDINTQLFVEQSIKQMSPFQNAYPDEICSFVNQHPKSPVWNQYYNNYHYNKLEVTR